MKTEVPIVPIVKLMVGGPSRFGAAWFDLVRKIPGTCGKVPSRFL
jgi:hypothetical protein